MKNEASAQAGNQVLTEQEKGKRLLSTLGLCVRAGKVIFGVPMICESLRRGGANAPCLVLEASDTSDNTSKRISDKCKHYQVKHVRLSCDGVTLARALGKTSSLAAVGLTDPKMMAVLEQYF